MLAFSIGREFTGSSRSGFIVPDTMGAVGPNHIVELINGRYAAYSKSGVQQSAKTLDEFWIDAGITPVDFAFDPRVLYDAASGRFFAVAADNPRNANSFLLAVSNTSDPTAGWNGFQIDSDADDTHWADFPLLGLGNDVVTVSANMFGLAGASTTVSFIVLPKNDLLLPTPTVANATFFENVNANSTGFAPQPIVDLDNGNLPLPILSSFNKSTGFLKTSSIGGTPLLPTLNTAGGFIPVTSRGDPPDIDQPGPKANIDAGDTRFGSSVIQQQIAGRGHASLWGVQSVNIGGRAAIEWYEIDTATNAVLQSGTISHASLGFNYPSIAVNDFGDVVIGFSGGDPDTFMSTYVAVGHTKEGITTFDPVTQTHAGVADYENLDSDGRNRWGDYSATVIDPTDQQRIWTFQEFASATDQWSIRITEIILSGVPNASIAGRRVFYNNSAFDVVSDDTAIAMGKSALLPGGTATSQNYTNYSRGLNGIMVDIVNLANPAGINIADFEFRVGNSNNPAGWALAQAPLSVTVQAGQGLNGSDRIKIIWVDNAIQNQWLRVTVLANADTGLVVPDIHYWGNLKGDAGNNSPSAIVDFTDLQLIFSDVFTAANVESAFDINHSGMVDFTDLQLSFQNVFAALNLITPSGGLEPESAAHIPAVAAAILDVPNDPNMFYRQRPELGASTLTVGLRKSPVLIELLRRRNEDGRYNSDHRPRLMNDVLDEELLDALARKMLLPMQE
jgi:hypothetical protein